MIAPVRIDLSAGFPDVQPFCQDRPGYIVNAALDLTVQVVLRRMSSRRSQNLSLPERLVVWTARELGLSENFDIEVATPGLTPGSGLGSSGALSVAVAYGLLTWADRPPSSIADVVALAVRAEQAAGVSGGTQDQWASACGGVGSVRQYQGRGERVEVNPHPRSLAAHVALVYPGGRRDSGAIIQAVTNESVLVRSTSIVAAMNTTAVEMVSALRGDDMDALAGLVNESREHLTRLHPSIVAIPIRDVIRTAPGVWGAKPCGAGGSSATWVVIRDPDAEEDFDLFVRSKGFTLIDAGLSRDGVRRR